MRKNLKLFAVVLLFIGFIQSCEDEPVQINNWTQLNHGTNDFIKRESISNYPIVNDYAQSLSKPKSTELYRTDNNNSTFTILEDIDVYIYIDSLATTYTIPIIKTNQTEFGFSNLVIKYQNDNPVEEFILNYVPTQEYLNSFVDYDQIHYQGSVEYETLETSNTESNRNLRTATCETVGITYCNWSESGQEEGYHVAGGNCTDAYMWTEYYVICNEDSNEDTYIDDTTSGGTGSPSNGGGTGSTNTTNNPPDTQQEEDNPETIPIPPDTCLSISGGVGLSNGDGCIELENPFDYDDCSVSNEDFNVYYSELSPFEVDLSLVREGCDDTIDTSAVEANANFMCIYNKLTESQSFKNLFIDTFGESKNLNVKFLIDDTITSNGNAGGSYTIDSQGEITTNWIIKISSSYITSASNVSMAKTILHECIHAFLKTKMLNCDLGATLPYLNNSELSEILNVFYNDWQCEPDVNGSPQSQHSFMFNYMLPTFEIIMTEIKPLLASEANYDYFDDINISNDNLNINEDWSWDRFIHYWSMTGLQNCTAFNETITPNAIENFMYNQYTMSESAFSANCN